MKPEIRVLGIDDGFFIKGQRGPVLIIGAIMRGIDELDGVVSTYVTQDGTDATQKLSELITKTKHKGQLRAIMLNGVTLAGFNVVDISELSRSARLPVIVVLRKRPDYKGIENALKHFADGGRRLEIIKRAGGIYSYRKLLYQCAGIRQDAAQQMIDIMLRKSNIPEPVRIAHVIASGVTKGESTKRA
jgi:hypothetical protein